MSWLRVGFKTTAEDYRPVKFPPPGPYWCTGYGDNYATMVAYVRNIEQISEYWPEVRIPEDIRFQDERDETTFTERFPKPKWWTEGKLMTTESTHSTDLSKKPQKIDTSSKHPSEMTNQELDATIATEIIGLYQTKIHSVEEDGMINVWWDEKDGAIPNYSPTTDANQAREAVIKWTSLYKFDEEPIFDKHADWNEAAGDAFSKKREKDLEVINQVKTYQKKLIQIIFSQDFDWYNELTNGLSLSFYVLQSILEATPRQQCEALILAVRELEGK